LGRRTEIQPGTDTVSTHKTCNYLMRSITIWGQASKITLLAKEVKVCSKPQPQGRGDYGKSCRNRWWKGGVPNKRCPTTWKKDKGARNIQEQNACHGFRGVVYQEKERAMLKGWVPLRVGGISKAKKDRSGRPDEGSCIWQGKEKIFEVGVRMALRGRADGYQGSGRSSKKRMKEGRIASDLKERRRLNRG